MSSEREEICQPEADPPWAETLMGMEGFEPSTFSGHGPEPCAYTSSATSPYFHSYFCGSIRNSNFFKLFTNSYIGLFLSKSKP